MFRVTEVRNQRAGEAPLDGLGTNLGLSVSLSVTLSRLGVNAKALRQVSTLSNYAKFALNHLSVTLRLTLSRVYAKLIWRRTLAFTPGCFGVGLGVINLAYTLRKLSVDAKAMVLRA